MKTTIRSQQSPREQGFALVLTLVMLAIAGVMVGSIATATITYRRTSEADYDREKAAFLADAGLQLALVSLNSFSEGNISYSQSRGYFSETAMMTASDWGFHTQIGYVYGTNVLTSTGRYGGKTVSVSAAVELGAGARSIHALYAHSLFAGTADGASGYTFSIGGTGSGADYVTGDTYSGGNISLSGSARLHLPEELVIDYNNDGICDPGTDTWHSAFATQYFTNGLTQAQFNTYSNSMAAYMSNVYNNGRFDEGEAYVDTIGNGVYDEGDLLNDSNGNGVRDLGDSYIDQNGNGVFDAGTDTVVDNGNGQYDAGEEWTEDASHSQRKNGRYDPAGGYWSGSTWKTTYKSGGKTKSCASWPAEQFEDVGDGNYTPEETYVDRNGVYDEGEQFLDDRNTVYDYGVQAVGSVTGMPSPGPGQSAAAGGSARISPPDLVHMYYNLDRDEPQPADALNRWGNDVTVNAAAYAANGMVVASLTNPCHIFVRNPPTSGSVNRGGKTINGRSYTALYDKNTNRVDDYFFEDPMDATYNTTPGESLAIAQDDDNKTHTMLVNVTSNDNVKLYYVDGNIYIHHPTAYSMRFRNPGTRITIVAKGNITISDEFYYNADYAPDIDYYTEMNSSVVNNPSDALCLIALKNPNSTNSGNIYIGDKQFGTGGSIHAMLYAENDFVDNNLNTVDQGFISIFGNMSAGDQVRINRLTGGGYYRTRLDVTLDERIRDGTIVVPGLPHPVASERSIWVDTAWHLVPGSWSSWSMLQ